MMKCDTRFAQIGFVVLLLLRFVGSAGWASSQEGAVLPEYAVIGAYLYNFAKFVEWPAHAFPSAESPLLLCTLGPDPFDPGLERQLREKKVGDRSLVLRHLRVSSEAQSCHILFISGNNRERIHQAVDRLKGKSVLIVGESPDFEQMGGMVQFVLDDGKVRFEINLRAAERSGLKVSSRLMQVAKAIRTE
jgi:hypothetical protein